MVGYCDYHEEDVDIATFEYKGCWTCRYFSSNSRLVDIREASEILKVHPNTIRRWIKKGKLEGNLFIRRRYSPALDPPYRKYFIYRESIEKALREIKSKNR